MFIDYLLSDRFCTMHRHYSHEQENKTDYHQPPWDLNSRGCDQHAKISHSYLYIQSSSNVKFISEATSHLNLKRIVSDLMFSYLVNMLTLPAQHSFLLPPKEDPEFLLGSHP